MSTRAAKLLQRWLNEQDHDGIGSVGHATRELLAELEKGDPGKPPGQLQLELTSEQRKHLRWLRTSPAIGDGNATLEQVVAYLVSSICDGLRRPGSWERGVVDQLFGDWHWEPPPLCGHCEFDLLDEDDALDMLTKHCETCRVDVIDAWEQKLLEAEPAPAPVEVWSAIANYAPYVLAQRAYNGDREAVAEAWKQCGGCAGCAAKLAPEATPVQCNGDAEPGRPVSDEVPDPDDSEGRGVRAGPADHES